MNVLLFALIFVILAILFFQLQRREAFRITLQNGRARLAKGKAPPGFIRDVEEICRRPGIERATVSGLRVESRVKLHFSADIPEPYRQRIRNAWGIHS